MVPNDSPHCWNETDPNVMTGRQEIQYHYHLARSHLSIYSTPLLTSACRLFEFSLADNPV